MSSQRLGLGATLRTMPATFWIANTMEIFERTAWYSFFTLSTLYITGPVAEGGLGFSSEQRGFLQGVVTFFLYLFPILTGALADRFGYKRMLFIAYSLLTPAYWLLGQFKSFGSFFFAFLLVALGAAVFKPVVISTVARVTNDRTASLGFGIFYMMVNIGGFFGPFVSSLARTRVGWGAIFVISTVAIAMNFLVLMLYREPTTESRSAERRSLKAVLTGIVEVLGNGRLFVTVAGALLLIVMGGGMRLLPWGTIFAATGAWIALNLLYDVALRAGGARGATWLTAPMRFGNWRFGVYLVLLSGFWTIYNQIMNTMPEYLRDFTDSGPVLRVVERVSSFIGLSSLAAFAGNMAASGTQIPPEQIVNLDALAIIVFQVGVSWAVTRLPTFQTLMVGVLIVAVSMVLPALAGPGVGVSAWLAIASVLVFSFGEMTTSPKSQEYVGRIAPSDKVALYMGYYFPCIALGNLFGGIASGALYGWLARDLRRPDIMWLVFAGIALVTVAALFAYDRWVLPSRSPATAPGERAA